VTPPINTRAVGPSPLRSSRQRLLQSIDAAAVAPQVTADDWFAARSWVTLLSLRGDGAVCSARTAELVEHLAENGFRAGEVVQGLTAALALGLVSLHYGAADGLDVWAIDWDRIAELAGDGFTASPETQEGRAQ
jgi:hypothetical protein